MRAPSLVLPIDCGDCGSALSVVVGTTREPPEANERNWVCPRCQARHQIEFNYRVLMVLPRQRD